MSERPGMQSDGSFHLNALVVLKGHSLKSSGQNTVRLCENLNSSLFYMHSSVRSVLQKSGVRKKEREGSHSSGIHKPDHLPKAGKKEQPPSTAVPHC